MPRRQPRKPSIGLNSCSSLTRCLIFSTGTPIFCGEVLLRRVLVRQEFVQRRVEGADGRRQALQFAEDAGEIVALVGQQLGQRLLPVLRGCRRGSSRAWSQCDCPRRTCARCGTGRCRWRRRRRRWRPARASRRWCGPAGAVTLAHHFISLQEDLKGAAFLRHRAVLSTSTWTISEGAVLSSPA